MLIPAVGDVDVATWILGAVREDRNAVGDLVPAAFESRARILHPIARGPGATVPSVRWADVATALGHKASLAPTIEWEELIHTYAGLPVHEQWGDWDGDPPMGALPKQQARALASVLARHTTRADLCYFGVWTGWAALGNQYRSAPVAPFPHRPMALLEGPLDEAATDLGEGLHSFQSANLWWPEDHSWIVSTDIDSRATIVGGSVPCIGEILADRALEAKLL